MTFRKILAAALTTFALGISDFSSQAALPSRSITIAWDPVSDSAVAGYLVYEGVASQSYTNIIDVGNNTSATLTGLAPGMTYYFAVATYDTNGLQGPISGEISYTVPALATLRLTSTSAKHPLLIGSCPPGWKYDVLATRDLSIWKTIGTITGDATGSAQFIDTNAINDRCFYRLRQTSP
jgi:hypothetical protein